MADDNFNSAFADQESQYKLPYHYIPSLSEGYFKQHLYWSWGYRYLGGMNLVLGFLKEISFESLLDVGCGDGRFLKEVNLLFPGKRILGIDYSQRAINMAKALNPHLKYECVDICSDSNAKSVYDVITLIEVLEHIEVDRVSDFISACADRLETNGKLIITVPHKNKHLQEKHFQHFDSNKIQEVLSSNFIIDRTIYFDKLSRVWNRLMSLLFGNSLYILNNRFLLKALYGFYQKFFFLCEEKNCGRVCVIAHKK